MTTRDSCLVFERKLNEKDHFVPLSHIPKIDD